MRNVFEHENFCSVLILQSPVSFPGSEGGQEIMLSSQSSRSSSVRSCLAEDDFGGVTTFTSSIFSSVASFVPSHAVNQNESRCLTQSL